MNGVAVPVDLEGHLRQIVNFPDTSASAGGTEGVDSILAPIFLDVIEHNAGPEFTEQLEAFTAEKVAEIEVMCNSNHQEFVGAVEKLLKARQGAAGLRLQMVDLNNELQKSGNALTLVMREHLQSQTTIQNIDEAIETLQKCLRVLGLSNRIHELIQRKKGYAALRALDELQNVHLNEIIQFDFAEVIRQSIPATRQLLQDSVMRDLKGWLLSIRENSKLVGEMAFRHIEKKREEWASLSEMDPILSNAGFNSALQRVFDEQDEFDPLQNDMLSINFQPLYEAIHIYTSLGKAEELRDTYDADRRKQMDLLIPSSLNVDEHAIELQNLLANIAGFAIIERATSIKVQTFRSASEVESLWDVMCARVIDLITDTVAKIVDSKLLLSVKDTLALFMQTVQRYDFQIIQIERYMLSLFRAYSDVLRRRFSSEFNQIIQDDNYMPMTVPSAQEFEVLRSVSLLPLEDVSNSFPQTLPFSQLYPSCCTNIRNFVNEYYMFSFVNMQSQHDVDELLRKSLDELLVANVNQPLSLRLDSKNLAQIVQILINLEYLENACKALEELLVQSRSSHHASMLKLSATSEFGNNRKMAEKRIFELVNSKIDDFLEIADYDWLSSAKNSHPSAYLQDVVAFLTTVVRTALQNLPQNIKTFVYFDALDHLATSLKNLILSAKRLTENAIANFDLDVRYLEDLVQNLGDASVANADTFLELRQSVNLLKNETSVEDYLQIQPRMRHYNRISAQDAVSLFEKLLSNSSAYSLNAQQRERRRLLENAITTLRSQRLK